MAKLTATDYYGLARHLDGARSGRIGHNTTGSLIMHGDRVGVEVRLHGHHIITLWDDGSAIFTMCGWGTVTTRDRLNQLLPPNFSVGQSQGVQMVQRRWGWEQRPSSVGEYWGWANREFDEISANDVLAVSMGADGIPAVSVMENLSGRRLADFYPVAVR